MSTYDTTMQETLSLPARASTSSSGERAENAWVVRTSAGGLAVVATLAMVFLVTSFHRLNHTDLWGHLALGRWMVDHRALVNAETLHDLAAGVLDANASHKAVVNVPWLAQVLGYATYRLAGADGLALGHAAIVTCACALVILAVTVRSGSLRWGVAAAIATYVLSLPVVGTIRPQLFGMLFLPCVLYGIADLKDRAQAILWLPVVMAVWANLHGSFAVGLIVLACWTAGVLLEKRRELRCFRDAVRDEEVRWYGAALILSLLACSVNPAGPALLWNVARFSGGSNLAEISEWRPLVLESLGGALFFASVLATFVVVRYSPRRLRAEEIVTLVVFAALSLSAMRMLAWWAILWPFVLAPHVAACFRRQRQPGAYENEATTRRTWLAVAIVFVAIIWSPPAHSLLTATPRGLGAATAPTTPLHVAEALEEHLVTGPLFAPMDWSDYLIWRNGAHVRPFVFTHVHLIAGAVWSDFLELSRGGAGWLDVIDAYGLKHLVLDRQRNGNLHMLALMSPRCRVLYQDQQAVLVEVLPVAVSQQAGQGGVAAAPVPPFTFETSTAERDVAGTPPTATPGNRHVDETPRPDRASGGGGAGA
ncbi:MAG: hypothetical protein KF708_22880 [Pirellulales bacterium]|nr:hypothetical protein [Pirellulales bacterium]